MVGSGHQEPAPLSTLMDESKPINSRACRERLEKAAEAGQFDGYKTSHRFDGLTAIRNGSDDVSTRKG
jgi:hypothetical protein